MELTVAKRDLLRLAARMQGVAERKSTMPVLSNVLFTAGGAGSLRLSATDLYLGLSGTIPAEISKPGSMAIPAKELVDRVKMMPDGPVQLATSDKDNGQATMRAVGSARRYTLRGMPGGDFPPLPQPAEGAPSLAIEVDVLAELIAKTHFSISTDETRAHLNSALFEWEGEIVRMVTTDGHRLSKMEVKVAGRQASATMLIPLKAIHELRRLCDEVLAEARDTKSERPQLTIVQSGSSAFFQAGSMTFSVKLVDAQFPPYSQVIPKSFAKSVRAPRTAFTEALRAVSVAANERTGGVKLSLQDGTLRISSESPESGEGFDELPVDYSGVPIAIGFNAKYFLDVLGALTTDEVTLNLSGELDPAVLRPGDGEPSERDFLAVVMPMRI
ncbi:MAG TPA: DNA polymerase III subunit beta [Polyangiaceae bacterium]|nr:DNA polymerase III subunit beta [Polyangiaceae bacterium]